LGFVDQEEGDDLGTRRSGQRAFVDVEFVGSDESVHKSFEVCLNFLKI
jgi:hypothetical protein